MGGTVALFYIGYQFVDLDSNTNTFLRISALSWFMIAMAIPLTHQVYTWICWRSELCWKSVSSSIGLKGYLIGFFILIISRFSAVVLCFVDYGSLYKPGLIAWALSIVVFIPGLYTMYSVKKYFGFVRAAGADHFDPKYRNMSFENRGIFKWFDNAVGVVIQKLVPRKTHFMGVNFVIESHMLERAKMTYNYSDVYLGDKNRHGLKSTMTLQQFVGQVKRF